VTLIIECKKANPEIKNWIFLQPRDEQQKVIKYNHLAANCLIFRNDCALTHVLSQLRDEGEDVPETALARISPYLTEHINRFGDYVLNMNRTPPQPAYDFTFRA
jgi:hypothetical protein